VFGTGVSAQSFVSNLISSETNVIGYLDNDASRQGKLLNGSPIYPPNQIKVLEFDYVVIASQFIQPIYDQLVGLNVNPSLIIPVFYRYFADEMQTYHKSILRQLYLRTDNLPDRPRITVVSNSYSGCNARAMFLFQPESIKQRYDVELLNEREAVVQADVVITTHRNVTLSTGKVNIELWHGFPLKAMGRMNQEKGDSVSAEAWQEVDGIASYSSLYTTLMNACFPTTAHQYRVTGMPRNDYLYQHGGRALLSQLIGLDFQDYQIVFYIPTFRNYQSRGTQEGSRTWGNLFDFEQFDEESFHQFLVRNKIMLFYKLHGFEEGTVRQNLLEGSHVHSLTESGLVQHQIDLYQILSAADVLITDYSSVYFDYLLMDRPILFTPTDLERYRETRGFLMEPYEWWTPGEKIGTQVDLEHHLLCSLTANDPHALHRRQIRDIVHHYQDGHSTERVWAMIDQIAQQGMSQ